jgi:AcrR family transcriptional regulator
LDKRLDRGRTTRQHIADTARVLFTEQGYEAVSTEAVRQACGISRGALFHHFPTKESMFTAVLEAVEASVAEHMLAAARTASNPLDALRAGCAAWLHLAARDPTVRQIVLTDAPAVVGWRTWREIDGAHGLGLLRHALAAAAEHGCVPADQIAIYAQGLLAVLIETALLIASASGDEQVVRSGQHFVELVVSRLFGVEPGSPWPGGTAPPAGAT